MYIHTYHFEPKPGRIKDATEEVLRACSILNDSCKHPSSVWGAFAGQPAGSLQVVTHLASTADLTEFIGSMSQNDDFQQATAVSDSPLRRSPMGTFDRIVGVSGEPDNDAPIVSCTVATIRSGQMASGMGLGGQILEHVARITGNGGTFTLGAAGSIFEVKWMFAMNDGGEMDVAGAKLDVDGDYVGLIDQGGSIFVDGGTRRTCLARLM